MFLFPISTDVHDGKIRLAALEIIALCIFLHLMVMFDTSRIDKTIDRMVNTFNAKQKELLSQKTLSFEELKKMLEDPNSSFNKERDAVENTITQIKESSLFYKLGFIPNKFNIFSLFSAMFIHGGWIHLLSNLLFFYVCGVAMEKYWGFWRFMLIYLICGVGANLFYMGSALAVPAAAATPLVGASGAIAGAMGAFAVTHTRVKVKIFWLFLWFHGTFRLPGYVYFGFWFLADLINMLSDTTGSSGIAYTAHVGGFMLGALLGRLVTSESKVSRVNRLPASHSHTRILSDESDYAPLLKEQTVDITGASFQKHIPLSVIGWHAFHNGDYPTAIDKLTHAINNYFQFREENAEKIKENIAHILRVSDRMSFPTPQLYQWAKDLLDMNETQLALTCYDYIAGDTTHPHMQKNSLLTASMHRIRTAEDLKKARADLKTVIDLDSGGIFGQQAEQIMRYMEKWEKQE